MPGTGRGCTRGGGRRPDRAIRRTRLAPLPGEAEVLTRRANTRRRAQPRLRRGCHTSTSCTRGVQPDPHLIGDLPRACPARSRAGQHPGTRAGELHRPRGPRSKTPGAPTAATSSTRRVGRTSIPAHKVVLHRGVQTRRRVEVRPVCPFYETLWAINRLNAKNNVSGAGRCRRRGLTLKHPEMSRGTRHSCARSSAAEGF